MQKYHYWGFGLNIESEIEFPELIPNEFDVADVTISLGKVPEMKGDIARDNKEVFVAFDERDYVLEIKGVSRYHVTGGNKIIVEPNPNADSSRSVRVFVLASAMAALLYQRALLPLHASAIRTENDLVLITGDSKAGKSTSLAGLGKRGYSIFSDDVVVLKEDGDGKVMATATYPMIKLWDDTVTALDHQDFSDRSFRIRPGMDKYGVFFRDSFNRESFPVAKAIVLKIGEVPKPICRVITGIEAFNELSKQVYRRGQMYSAGRKEVGFRTIAAMLQDCTVYEITRPQKNDPELLIDEIERILNKEHSL
jgi:hypothetical protein